MDADESEVVDKALELEFWTLKVEDECPAKAGRLEIVEALRDVFICDRLRAL